MVYRSKVVSLKEQPLTIPDFQTLMLPLLEFASDQREHTPREAIDKLATTFELSSEERKALLPSGRQSIFDNRVHWALSHLRHAGLLYSARRGYFSMTPRGLEVLQARPARIDLRYLAQFPGFQQFRGEGNRRDKTNGAEPDPATPDIPETPEETLENSYQRVHQNLSQELLTRVKAVSPAFFERLVVELLVAMGYGGSRKDAGEAVGKSGDEGIDGIIKEDKLGLDIIYIQAKRWENVVGRPEIHRFVGALQGQRAKKGVFITTSAFTKDAREYVSRIESKIVLIDGEQLARLMIDNDVGVSKVITYEVKRLDSDYFAEE